MRIHSLLIFSLVLLLNESSAVAQNLVPNHSFENPPDASGQLFLTECSPWSAPAGVGGSPDVCSSVAPSYCPIQPAQEGIKFARAGFKALLSTQYTKREYLSSPLLCPLVAGETYDVSFYVSMDPTNSDVTCEECVQIVLTSAPVDGGGAIGWEPLGTLVTASHTSLIRPNAATWQKVSFSYLATGGERYLTVGIFKESADVTWIPANGTRGFLLYDNFEVVCTSGCPPPATPTFAGIPTKICRNDFLAAFPTTSDDGIEGTWSPAPNNQVTTKYTFEPKIEITFNGGNGQPFTDIDWIIECALPATHTVIIEDCIVPAFSMTDTVFCVGECIDFTDLTLINAGSTITNWNWTFETGSPSTSTDQNPLGICFNTAGAYKVTLEVTNDNGLVADTTISVNISGTFDPSFNYTSLALCGLPVQPNITGDIGGTFTSTPAGLSISSFTGRIIPATSTVGTYDVTYTTIGICPRDSTLSVSILPSPSIDPIGDQAICLGENFAAVNFTGSAGATFAWSNNNSAIGLAANGVGDIPVFAGTTSTSKEVANISVTPSTGSCNGIPTNFTYTVDTPGDASYTYAQTIFCVSDVAIAPSIEGDMGGVFTSTPLGLSLDALTGEIVPGTSIAGVYDLTYTVTGVCDKDSTITITISPPPSVDPRPDQVVCAGDNFNVINFTGSAGATFDWTNTNTDIGLAANNTGGILSFVGTAVTSVELGTIEVTPIAGSCRGTSETFTLTVNPPDDASFTYPSSSICLQAAALLPTVTGLGGGMFTSTIGLSIDAATGEVTPGTSTLGSYNVTYTTNGTCSNSDIFNLSIVGPPTIDPVFDQMTCSESDFTTINFTGTPGATYSWTNSKTSIGLSALGTGDISAFTAIGSGIVEVAAIEVTPNVGACIGIPINFNLTVNPLDDPSYNYTTRTFCITDTPVTPVFNGDLGGTFTSLPAGLMIDGVTGEITPTTSSAGVYSVTYTVANVCANDSTLNITIYAQPTVDLVSDQKICDNDSFTTINFTGTGTTFNWTNSNPAIGLSASGTGDISAFDGVLSGNYSGATIEVIPSASSCIGQPLTFELGVSALPTVLFEADVLEGCAPLTVNFSNLSPEAGDCFWDFGNGESSTIPDCSGATFIYNEPGLYDVTFSLTNTEGCTSTTQINKYINVIQAPEAIFIMNPAKLIGGQKEVEFTNKSTNALVYNWDFGDEGLSAEESPNHEFTIEGEESSTITLWVHNDYCSDSTQQTIGVIEDLIFYVPNAFTPNGDGMNQIFQPVFTSGFNADDYELFIFNRWGEQLFQSSAAEVGWNGTYNGIVVQDGIYTWKILVSDTANEIQHQRIGSVVLIK